MRRGFDAAIKTDRVFRRCSCSLKMKRAYSDLLSCLGLNRPSPKTRVGRYIRYAERILAVLAALDTGLYVFPQTLFADSVTANGITIYSRSPLPPEAASCAARAAELLNQSE